MRRLLRPLSVAVALAMTTVACDAANDVAGEIGDVASSISEEAVAPEQPQDGETSGGTGQEPAPEGTGTGEGQQSAPTSPDGATAEQPSGDAGGGQSGDQGSAPTAELTPVDDLGRVGANARAMLRADRPTLVVEVDVQQGQQVDQAALDHMVSQLQQNADKPGGIRFAGGNTFTSSRTEWSTSDLRAVAQANRQNYSTPEQTALYLLYVDGSFYSDGQETSAIGVAYNASEFSLFPDKWSGLGGLLGSDRAIERSVLTHELGHILGLVNLVYESDIDHEDDEHPGHSDNRGSVMFWAVETTLIGQVFSGPPPDSFDQADRSDLEGLRTGRL